jgi:hypothetical protein
VRRTVAVECVVDGVVSDVPPERGSATKGQCKYAFAELIEVGYAMRVYERPIGTVRSALKRWVSMEKARKSLRFQVWRMRDAAGRACVRVKRIR